MLFTPLTAVLFTFPSRYLFTIGHQLVFSLTPWSAQFRAKFHVYRTTQDILRTVSGFRLRVFHPLWSNFPEASPNTRLFISGSYNPRGSPSGLGYSGFVRHYFQNRFRFLFLRVLRCFTSPSMTHHISVMCTSLPVQVTPLGNLRVKASLPLPEAYRSLARPSSSSGAKASTVRPFLIS